MQSFSDILSLITYFAIGYVLFRLITAYFEIRSVIKQAIEKAESSTEKVVPVKFELIDNVYFVWSTDNNEFLAQGKNYKELIDNLQARFKNGMKMNVEPDDLVYQQFKLTKES